MQTFTQWLKQFNEVSQDNLNKIGKSLKRFKKNDTLFDNIFGNKKRIAFPLSGQDTDINNFIQDMQKLDIPISINNLKDGYVTSTIKTQNGSKQRKMRVSSYLQNLAKETDNKDKIYDLLKNWSVIKDKLTKMDLNQGYSIIISRYPTDILRMSDHVNDDGKEIESCHSPGKEWFKCAIRESQIGGVVAYAVTSSDLLEINDLQADEIFKDNDRNKNGIIPIERLRLRRFHNENKNIDLLIPEIKSYSLRTYGSSSKQVPDFINAVNKWAKSVQEKEISQINPEKDFEEFNLRGGSYQDSGASTIWNKFFKTNVTGNKTSVDQSDLSAKTIEEWETRAEDMIRDHKFKKFNVPMHAKQYGMNIIGTWKAETEFEYNGWDFVKPPEQKDIEKIIPNSSDPEHNLSDYIRTTYRQGPPLYVFLNEATVPPPNDRNYGKVSITISTSERNGSLDDFEHFLDTMDYLDKNIDEINAHIEFWFTHNGFMENKIKNISDNKTFNHFDVKPLQFNEPQKHTGVKWEYEISSEWFAVGDATNFTDKLCGQNMIFNLHNLDEFVFIKFQNDPAKIIKVNNLKFKVKVKPSFFEILRNKSYKQKPLLNTDLVYAKFQYKKAPHNDESEIKKTFGVVNVIDKNWNMYVDQVKQWWNGKMLPHIKQVKEIEDNQEANDIMLLRKLKT